MDADLHLLDIPQHLLQDLSKVAQSPDLLESTVILAEEASNLKTKQNASLT